MARYLRISIEGQSGYFKAFVNKRKMKANEPDYTGRNIAIWINQKRFETTGPQVPNSGQQVIAPPAVRETVAMPADEL